MLLLEDISLTDNGMQIHVHMLKDQVDVNIIGWFQDILQLYDIGML